MLGNFSSRSALLFDFPEYVFVVNNAGLYEGLPHHILRDGEHAYARVVNWRAILQLWPNGLREENIRLTLTNNGTAECRQPLKTDKTKEDVLIGHVFSEHSSDLGSHGPRIDYSIVAEHKAVRNSHCAKALLIPANLRAVAECMYTYTS